MINETTPVLYQLKDPDGVTHSNDYNTWVPIINEFECSEKTKSVIIILKHTDGILFFNG